MASNYPPGVTGNEFEIAGPDFEGDTPRPCPECGGEMYEIGFQGARWWTCEGCGHEAESPATHDPGDPWADSDDARDRLLDR